VGRDQAPVEDPQQVERAELGRHERVHLVPPRPPPEEVHASTPQLARARAAQNDTQPAVLDQPVHLVEQGRHLLHFVDDDLCR